MSIPTDATEVFILCYFTNTPQISFTWTVPVAAIDGMPLPSYGISLRQGYYVSSDQNGFTDCIITPQKAITFAGTNGGRLNGQSVARSLKAWYR